MSEIEERLRLSERNPLSIYLHVPFCTTKCTYCAFNTYTHIEHLIPPFVNALANEIRYVGRSATQRQVASVFFGGGTPSLLGAQHYEQLFAAMRAEFTFTEDVEITLEANPNDMSRAYADGLHSVGFNRISIGMQSANARELHLFRRRHGVDEVAAAVSAARAGGFENINLDLIYGIPDQTMADWRNTVEQALALAPDHISMYGLGIEENTPMDVWVKRGLVALPDDDLAADMYDDAGEKLGAAGYTQYEISNWARAGRMSRHNRQYWLSLPYLGLGPGGHGFMDGVRYATLLSPQRYIRALDDAALDIAGEHPFPWTPAVETWARLSRDEEISEMLIMGLRLLNEGIDLEAFASRFGVNLMTLHGSTMQRFADQGLVSISETHVRLTAQGALLSNVVFRELV